MQDRRTATIKQDEEANVHPSNLEPCPMFSNNEKVIDFWKVSLPVIQL